MFLEEIELIGFKSFVKARFYLKRGVTCFVGPNGCGKSNIADAIKWVLGEQSSSALRCRSISDLIFYGTEKRKPVGMAEVSILLDNTKAILPVDFESVKVTRRLFGSGESEYKINNTPCRLKDITSLFLDTGLGMGGYSFMEQSRIDLILKKPDERISLFEEAAGISRYKFRRQEAQSRLRKTAENIIRMRDLLTEIASYARSLKYQAKKAKRFKRLKEEAERLSLSLAQKRYQDLLKEHKEKKRIHIELLEKEAELRKSIFEKNGMIKRRKKQQKEKDRELKERRELLLQIKEKKERRREEAARLEEKKKYLSDRKEMIKKECRSLAERREKIGSELVRINDEKKRVVAMIERIEEELLCEQKSLIEIEAERKRAEEEQEEAKSLVIEVLSRKADVSNQLARITGELKMLSQRRLRLGDEMEKIEERERELRTLREDCLKEKIGIEDRIENQKEKVLRAEKEMATISSAIDRLKERREELFAEKRAKSANLSVLSKLPRYKKAVEKVLSERIADPSQIVANRIELPTEIAKAVESVLGIRTEAIVVESKQEAERIISQIKDKGIGRVAIFILHRKRGKDKTALKADGVIGRAEDMIVCEDERLLSLFSDILIVKDLDTALKFSNNGWKAVTLSGEVVDSNVIETGEAEMGLIRERIEDLLSKEISLLQKEIDALSSEIEKKEKVKLELYEDIGKERKRFEEYRRNLAKTIEREREMEGEMERLIERRASVKDELKDIGERMEENRSKEVSLKQKEKGLIEDAKEKERSISKLTASLSSLMEEEKRKRSSIIKREVELASMAERKRSLLLYEEEKKGEMVRLEEKERDVQYEMGKIEKEEKRTERTLLQTKRSIDILIEKEKKVVISIERLEEESIPLEKEVSHLQEERESQLSEIEREGAKIKEIDVELSFLSERLSNMVNEFGEDVRKECPEELDENRLRRVKEELKRMGDVNLLALSDYEKAKERIEFYNKELSDLTKAKCDLERLIAELDKRSKEEFLSSFYTIRNNFSLIFSEVFEGGEGDLIYNDGEIDIIARPPGKRGKSLQLLSSGERALTAICLLFALFMTKPAPFCVLDEIDSALDDVNIERFTKLLSLFSKDTQFLVITHNKKTIGSADTVYGITMEEPGISTILSLRLKKFDDKSEEAV